MSSTKAGVQLLQRLPSRKSHGATAGIAALSQEAFGEDVDAHAAFLDAVVTGSSSRPRVAVCPNSLPRALSGSPAHSIVLSEYNRDGDAYRCPTCNKFFHITSAGGEEVEGAGALRGVSRQLEVLANNAFDEYAKLYYGANRTVCVYAWDATRIVADSDQEQPEEQAEGAAFGVAVFINHHKPDASEEETAGTWCSVHVAGVAASGDEALFTLSSTVHLELAPGTGGAFGAQRSRFDGTLSKPPRRFARTGLVSSSSTSLLNVNGVVAELGDAVQAMENACRSAIADVYLTKPRQILAALRNEEAGGESTAAADELAPTLDAAPTLDDEVSKPRSKKEKKKRKAKVLWEAAVDEEGNTYYFNVETGETAWEMPVAEGDMGDGSVPAAEGEAAVAAAAEGGPSVREVLESLQLAQPAEDYYAALKKHAKRVHGAKLDVALLIALADETVVVPPDGEEADQQEGDNAEGGVEKPALEVLIPVYGDRRKVLRWISKSAGGE